MHTIEPYYQWRNLYTAEEDPYSPFYGREYSEFEFTDAIYDHVIHPQWDFIGSSTLYIKILYADYDEGYCIIEMIGEWNDYLYNDIMSLKRNIIDDLTYRGINKFILIAENVLNFHSSDDCYYEEWFEDIDEGWIAVLNLHQHVAEDFISAGIDQYFIHGGNLNDFAWRTYRPMQLFQKVEQFINRRLNPAEVSQ